MPSASTDYSINLIKERKPKFIEQLISWSLTVGRALVIITETIALSAFLYRFDLDARISDLNDDVKSRQNIIRYYKPTEDNFRNIQNRLLLANAVIKTQNQTLLLYRDITGLIPSGVKIKTFIFSPDTIKIEASVSSINVLSQLTKNLQEYSRTTKVSVDTIENKPELGVILANITANFKTQKYTPL